MSRELTPISVTDVQLTATAVAFYTVPDNYTATINAVLLCNTTSAAVSGININISAAGSAVADANRVVSNDTLAGNQTIRLPLSGVIIPAGGKLYGRAGTNSQVSISIYGFARLERA